MFNSFSRIKYLITGPLGKSGTAIIYATVSDGRPCSLKTHPGKENRTGVYANVRSGAIHDFIIDAVSDVIIGTFIISIAYLPYHSVFSSLK